MKQQKKSLKWLLLILLYSSFLMWGCVEILSSTTFLYLGICYFLASVAVQWAVLDAKERNEPILYSVQFIMLISWPVAMPIYLIYSRGLKGLGWCTVNIIGLYAAWLLGAYGTYYLLC